MDGYVYVAKPLSAEGIDNFKGIGDYLYYTQSTQRSTSVKRIPLATEDKGTLSFKESETIISIMRNFLIMERRRSRSTL